MSKSLLCRSFIKYVIKKQHGTFNVSITLQYYKNLLSKSTLYEDNSTLITSTLYITHIIHYVAKH